MDAFFLFLCIGNNRLHGELPSEIGLLAASLEDLVLCKQRFRSFFGMRVPLRWNDLIGILTFVFCLFDLQQATNSRVIFLQNWQCSPTWSYSISVRYIIIFLCYYFMRAYYYLKSLTVNQLLIFPSLRYYSQQWLRWKRSWWVGGNRFIGGNLCQIECFEWQFGS
jgi:hypothetical protein